MPRSDLDSFGQPSLDLFNAVQYASLFIGELDVAEVLDDLEYFATSREHPSTGSFVTVQSLHELDLSIGVLSFAGGGIDLSAALLLPPRRLSRLGCPRVRFGGLETRVSSI